MIRRRLLTGSCSNLASKAIAVGTWFLMTPYLLEKLGAGGYALWVLLASTASYGFLLELGIGGAVIKYVAEHVARGERQAAREVIASAMWLFAGLAIGALALTFVIAPLLPTLLGVAAEARDETRWLIVIMGVNVAITVAMTPAFSVLRGLQRHDLVNGTHVIATFGEAAGVIGALAAGGGLFGLVVALMPVNLLAWGLATWLVRRTAPDLRISLRGGTSAAVRRIASFSGSLFTINLAGRLQTRTDEFVIALFRPLAAVTPYALARKLAELSEMLVMQCVKVAMPLASELHAGHDRQKLQALYVAASRLTIAVAMPVLIVLAVLGGDVLTLWVGPAYAVHAPLVAVLAVAYFFRSSQCAAVEILQGMARHHVIAVTSLVSGAVNVLLSVILLQSMGVLGVAVGTLIPNAVALVCVVVPFANRTIGISSRRALKEIWIPAVMPASAAATALWLFQLQFDWPALASVLAGGAVTTVVYGLGYLSMPAAGLERRLLRDVIGGGSGRARRLVPQFLAGGRGHGNHGDAPGGGVSTRIRLSLRNLYAACLNPWPDAWFLPIRAGYVNAREGSARRAVFCRLLHCLRYKDPDRRHDSFSLADEPGIRLANVNSIVVRHLYWFGLSGWEGREIRAWQYFCSRATSILEIGANVGFYTVCGAQSAPGAVYTAVEPHPRTARILRKNLALNGLEHVSLIEAAAVGRKTVDQMQLVVPIADQDETPPGSFLHTGGEVTVAGRVSYDVSIVDVHDLLPGVDLLKLDVEGYEFDILNPIREFLIRTRPTLFVEVLPEARKLHQLIAELARCGAYRIYVSGTTPTEVDAEVISSGRLQSRHQSRDVFLVDAARELPLAELTRMQSIPPPAANAA